MLAAEGLQHALRSQLRQRRSQHWRQDGPDNTAFGPPRLTVGVYTLLRGRGNFVRHSKLSSFIASRLPASEEWAANFSGGFPRMTCVRAGKVMDSWNEKTLVHRTPS